MRHILGHGQGTTRAPSARRPGASRNGVAVVARPAVLLLIFATSAFAGIGGSVVPSFPPNLNVGDIKTGSITITNSATAPNNTEVVNVLGIVVTPSCAVDDGFTCSTAGPAVFQFASVLGKFGSSCAGIPFTIVPTQNAGEFALVPPGNTAVALGPSNNSGPLPRQCVIQLNFQVLRAPPGSPPPPTRTTDSLANATLQSATNSGFAGGLTTTPVTAPSLSISNTPNAQLINAGDLAAFTIVVSNAGDGLAKNVTLSDPLPNIAGLAWQLNPAVTGCSISGATSPQTLTCNSLGVPAGQAQTLTASAQTTVQQCNTMPNTASITATNGLALSPAASASASITCIQQATLNKAFNPTTISDGGTSVLTFTVTNPATNNPPQTVGFTDTLPTGLKLAATPVVSNGCGGSLTAVAGSNTIALSGGTVLASTAVVKTCTVMVNVTNASGQFNPSCANFPPAFTNQGLANAPPNNISALSNLTDAVVRSCLTVLPIADLSITNTNGVSVVN